MREPIKEITIMKSFRGALIWAAVLFMASSGADPSVYASSCNKGDYGAKSGHKSFNKHFGDMDANGDESLSFDEFKKAFPSSKQTGFDRLDSDKNGALSHEEWHQFKEMHKGMGKYHGKRYHSKKLPDPSAFNAHFSGHGQ
jgi:hypothetical protein